jgi:hypothetical protein
MVTNIFFKNTFVMEIILHVFSLKIDEEKRNTSVQTIKNQVTMKNLSVLKFFILAAGILTGIAMSVFFPENAVMNLAGSGAILAFAIASSGDITEGLLANIRRWHGSIDDRFSNIDNLVTILTENKSAWIVPTTLLEKLTANRDLLQTLINICRSAEGSKSDRENRNALLKSTVRFCLRDVKAWVYQANIAGAISDADVHSLGFLTLGERGGGRKRSKPTDIIAEVKVKVLNADFIEAIIDQASDKNAGPVLRGWPDGVKNVLVVITASDGKTEVYRQLTTHLHNEIQMPEGSHGKQFIIKAAFLKHVDDKPKFGNQPTFSMSLTTEDLASGGEEN